MNNIKKVFAPRAIPVEARSLRCGSALGGLEFKTTDDLQDLDYMPGQERAADAIRFGVSIRRDGFNLFALGTAGTGRETLVRRILEEEAKRSPRPDDLCYVNNFSDAARPALLRLPAGRGRLFRADMSKLVEELNVVLTSVFESEDYRKRVEEISGEFSEREEQALTELAKRAADAGIGLMRTPNGFVLAPMRDGAVLGAEEFAKLSDEERERINETIAAHQERLSKVLQQVPQWARQHRNRIRALNREYSTLAVGQVIVDVTERYRDLPDVLEFLEALRADVIENADLIRSAQERPREMFGIPMQVGPDAHRYAVNLIVDHEQTTCAPIVFEDRPTHPNLLGRVEYGERFGAMVTDFTLIRAGALHHANGGYLILDARKLLEQPLSWDALKRALRAHEVRIESLGHMLSLVSSKSLEPEPVRLDIKVVLIGDRLQYYLLFEYDPEFRELFKVAADFEDVVDRDDATEQLYARYIATLARKHELLPLTRAAVVEVIERAARIAEDTERLIAQVARIADLLREADHWARQRAAIQIAAEDVERALAEQERRAGRLRTRMREQIVRGTVNVATSGSEIGQINGLSVFPIGEFTFAQPTRITATVRLGEGEIVDIERESKLGGNIHSKAVMILGAFLAARYASDFPLALRASLVFEQTYGGVEGDSASVAELCALLSAIAQVPLKQDLAVTGSIDQLGRVQAIGGVNEKIEGFFDLCKARGLNGQQGVLIPKSNLQHLMLRKDVVAACDEGKFAVYGIEHVDDALELYTGMPMGEPDADGNLPEDCLNFLLIARLAEFSTLRRQYGAPLQYAAAGDTQDDGSEASSPKPQNVRHRRFYARRPGA